MSANRKHKNRSMKDNSPKLIPFENSKHLFCFWDEPKRYVKEVFSFIGQWGEK